MRTDAIPHMVTRPSTETSGRMRCVSLVANSGSRVENVW